MTTDREARAREVLAGVMHDGGFPNEAVDIRNGLDVAMGDGWAIRAMLAFANTRHPAEVGDIPAWVAADSPSRAYGMGAAENDVDAIAYALFDAFAKAEPREGITRYPASYWATFAAMARAVQVLLAAAPTPPLPAQSNDAGGEGRLQTALRRAASDLQVCPRHNRDGAADRHIEESRDRIRAALSAPIGGASTNAAALLDAGFAAMREVVSKAWIAADDSSDDFSPHSHVAVPNDSFEALSDALYSLEALTPDGCGMVGIGAVPELMSRTIAALSAPPPVQAGEVERLRAAADPFRRLWLVSYAPFDNGVGGGVGRSSEDDGIALTMPTAWPTIGDLRTLADALSTPVSQPTEARIRAALTLIEDMLPHLEPARLREEAEAKEREIDRMPIRQIFRRAAALRQSGADEREAGNG